MSWNAHFRRCFLKTLKKIVPILVNNLTLSKQMATKKILEKMKQDENLRSFEGSSGPLSDDLEDSEDDDDGLSQVLTDLENNMF